MAGGKWGESFLKSGMPLEHATMMAFRDQNYFCSPGIEYECRDGDGFKWRELDLFATSRVPNRDTSLSFLVECKYHDLSRFWFFLPHTEGRWSFNSRVFNCGPIEMLSRPRADGALKLAPLSYSGMVVSEDGQRQENTVHNALRQLSSGFVPYCLSQFAYCLDVIPGYAPFATAVVPMLVTNARIFRLRPEVTAINTIREASAPADIADEVTWTWCNFDPSMEAFDQNLRYVDEHEVREAELLEEFPAAHTDLRTLASRPNWIAVVNLEHLTKSIGAIEQYFMSIATRSSEGIFGVRARRA